ncbi:DinB family protein [Nocardia abscessus]|uniref:DinB family protein n=1 Tax=Nocardia abscessus TaxID=120957 RepID=UPI001894481C|nr:DinB family protein [Nocardia abscessus]MBF6341860.1 DinB family protein [Nocardia abscessus]
MASGPWQSARHDRPDPKADLHRYLRYAREAMLWKLDGLSEYDVRRPMTPTGTNLLGLVKHLGTVELGYFGDTFTRPYHEPFTDHDFQADPTADMWATAEQSREDIIGFYRRAWAHADTTIDSLDLDAKGSVPWWSEQHQAVTLHQVLVHVTTETHRHAGHADIIRELIDGAAGLLDGNGNMPTSDATWWQQYRAELEKTAQRAQDSVGR